MVGSEGMQPSSKDSTNFLKICKEYVTRIKDLEMEPEVDEGGEEDRERTDSETAEAREEERYRVGKKAAGK